MYYITDNCSGHDSLTRCQHNDRQKMLSWCHCFMTMLQCTSSRLLSKLSVTVDLFSPVSALSNY